MNKKQPVKTIFLLASMLTLTFGVLLAATGGQVYAKNIWAGDNTMEELVKKIDKGKASDDSMNWKDFKNSKVFKQEDKETKECIEKRQDLFNNLADYEVLHCFKDSEYGYKSYDPITLLFLISFYIYNYYYQFTNTQYRKFNYKIQIIMTIHITFIRHRQIIDLNCLQIY